MIKISLDNSATKEIEQFVINTNERILSYINEKYNCQLNPLFSFSFNPLEMRESYCKTRLGKTSIYLSLAEFVLNLQNNELAVFNEYPEFRNDPYIGSVINVSWQQAVTALIAHEIAHSVQNDYSSKQKAIEKNGFSYAKSNSKVLKKHGSFWKSIYRDLREQFVNHWNNPVKENNPPVKEIENKPKKLNTRYVYRGNISFIQFFVYDELKLIIAKDKKDLFLSNNEYELLDKLHFSSVTEARRSLIGV